MTTTSLSHTSTFMVHDTDTALAQGSGDMPVLSTPRLSALMENAAMLTVAGTLETGQTTVGGQISLTHLAPSPVGAEVAATATLTAQDGKKLTFSIEAYEGGKLIGQATHLRFIVNRERFLDKIHQQ